MQYSLKRFVGIVIGSMSAIALPFFAYAQTYTPLSGELPTFLENAINSGSMADLVNALVAIAVAASAVLAVVMLAIGGFKYMTTDSIFQMGNAKEQIANALIGILIVLMAVLILATINPEMVKLNLFKP